MKRLKSFRRARSKYHHRLAEDIEYSQPLQSSEPCTESLTSDVVASVEQHMAEQQQLVLLLEEFHGTLEEGADGDALLCSASFRHTLLRLGQLQQQQRRWARKREPMSAMLGTDRDAPCGEVRSSSPVIQPASACVQAADLLIFFVAAS